MLSKIVVFIFMIGFSSGLGVDFDCPDDIYVGESFECEVEVEEGNGVYDLKVEVDKERNSVLRIWTGEIWQSGYYYLIGFIENDEVVRLKVSEMGRYDVVLKLRKGSEVVGFEVGRIKVKEAVEEVKGEGEGETEIGIPPRSTPGTRTSEEAYYTDYTDFDGEGASEEVRVIDLSGDDAVISLGDDAFGKAPHEYSYDESEWDYVSKDGRVIDWLPYGFCLFLIGLVGVLVWDRRDCYT